MAFLPVALFALFLSAQTALANNRIALLEPARAPSGFDGVCARLPWACAPGRAGRVSGTKAMLSTALSVNLFVNAKVREISDQRQYGQPDHWDLPTQRGGDCEDFALLKKRELIKRGIAPDNLLIATVLQPNREAHAVLVLRTGGGDFVLDNLTNKIKRWDETGYFFLRIQDAGSVSNWRFVMAGGGS
ncbi:transglutaminase-like cysteine peptidase [Oceanomicrobium pacificus]|uniref:Transglutaminase n=1 Tax=Oceanomicrobium pacificus TaxID=2692916 RepID=A0A6B0TYI1_9RHOB|nr:transglutaminase-like cysteine peptidase [Oceanomicrobium pacificus]MXU66755.1 hypothetical protein [Oceanomicrobium pacificus]